MLAAVLAAQTLTQQDTKASRQHADAILTQLLARLAALRPTAIKRLAKEGSALHVFGAAADALDEWQAQLGLGARVVTPVLVRRFQLAHEPLQFVLGETQDLRTLRPLYKAATTSALAITGGVLALPVAVAMIGTLPIVASEAGLMTSGGRMVAQRLVAWGVANPGLALATTEMMLGFAFTADPADYTWENLCLVYSDPKTAAMFTAQMLMDIMHLRMAGHSDMGMSPTSRRSAASGGEPAAAPTGSRGAGARPAIQPTAADESVLRQRVQKMLAVRDNILHETQQPQPSKENARSGASTGATHDPSPAQATSRTKTVANAEAHNVTPTPYDLKPLESLNRRQRAIHDKLPAKGAMVVVSKKTVSMSDLRALGRVTGDEYSMYTKKGERLIIRGDGPKVVVPDEAFAEALRGGEHGKWSGHTLPPGSSGEPGPADKPNIPAAQSRSGIWSDSGASPFYRDTIAEEAQRRMDFRKLYESQ